MGRYLRKARFHAQQIKYYYTYAGKAGYAQAEFHWDQLGDLELRAMRSKNDKNDAPAIGAMRQSKKQMMMEMEKRAKA